MRQMLIRLEEKEKKLLKIYSKEAGISESAAVRQGLGLLFKSINRCASCGRRK